MTKHFIRLVVVAAFVSLTGCTEEGEPARPDRDPSTRPVSGESVYTSRFTDGNTFACATCHVLSEPAPDGVRRVGHPIGDAAARPSFKNGQYSKLLDAVNTCVTEWMLAPALDEDDQRWSALRTDSATYPRLSGGRMPFWGEDRLSDTELLDLVAFVEMLGQRERPQSVGPSLAGDGPVRSCLQTHPRVGQIARLGLESGPTLHRVAGTVQVIDDCTLRIDEFSYDGNGIDVRVYAGLGGRFAPLVGFAISENFVDRAFDGTESFTVQLPEGVTLDDFDGVSIWCVAVGADFGHALFPRGAPVNTLSRSRV